MSQSAWLLPALPALAALVGLLMRPALVAIGGTFAAFVVSLLVVADVESAPAVSHETSVAWTPAGGLALHIGTRVDGLAAVVAVMVCVVALLVQIYSVAYMAGDPRYAAYAAEVSLFTAAMLLVVVASDLFELLIGWEVMGLCSYLLIGHYWQTEGARAAAVKAFVTTRLGDTGFLFGIFVLGLGAGTFDIAGVTANGGRHTALTVGLLLLLAGVVGKSAQFPLHVWLPDAMAGPTPISALIHAATMVAAGIFVVARLYPLFLIDHVATDVLAAIACITMLGAALAAFAEDDLKRVLAWSTVSQLAYMAGGLAVGGFTAGIYHLLTHAAFKALLFLAAGSVLRAVGSGLMSEMGGLRRRMPVTFVTALIGAAALAGIPPFAGAFSKDAVLDAAREHGGATGTAVYVVGLVTVFVTAAYVTRFVLRTFFGEYRGGDVEQVSESSRLMTAPLVVLATAVLALGIPALPQGIGVRRWLDAPAGSTAMHVTWVGGLTTTVIALAGAGAVVAVYRKLHGWDPLLAMRRASIPLANAFWVDAFYDRALVRPIRAIAVAMSATEDRGVDAAAESLGAVARGSGGLLRRLQTGNAQAYLSGLVVAVLAIVIGVSVAVR